MLHGEALQVPGTVQVLEGRGQSPESGALTHPPGTPAPRTAVPPQHPSQQPHLPPLPELLLHQSADTKLLVHLLQQLGL